MRIGFGSGGMAKSALLSALFAASICLAGFVGAHYFGGGPESAALRTGSVQLAGSETMRPVVTTCAEDFMTRNPQADIIVKGGGSGDGIAALLHGIVDIGMMSRELSDREREFAVSQGIELTMSGLALDGITVIVNRAITVADLDVGQLRRIFAGKSRNWVEFGGGDAEILPFARAAGSGTASLFGDRVLRDETYATSVQRLPTNEAIVAEVATRRGAIGYADLGASKGAGDRIKVLALRTLSESAPVSPTSDTIHSGSYPLARTLYFGTAENPSDAARAFLDFCLGANGRALLERAGYVAMKHAAK